MPNKFLWISVLIILVLGGYAIKHELGDTHTHKETAHENEQTQEDSTLISAEAAARGGIETLPAGPASIRETLTLNGRIVLNANKTTQIKARFPGIVRAVKKSVGENVEKGEELAKIEGNDSLLVYPVKSPIHGTVLERNTNMGDVAGDQPLFVIADLSEMWAEFFVFPRDADRIQPGQPVFLRATSGDTKAESRIDALLPVAESATQTILARAVVANPEGHWRAGMNVNAEAAVSERQVSLAVATAALQRFEGGMVVFVREGERYTARPVKIGMQDTQWAEITEGLNAGEEYVAKNSFVVKADIGKASAEHAH